MISLREMDPGSPTDAEEYLALLARAAYNPEVTTYLPEILEETRIDDVRRSLQSVSRYLIIIETRVAGRLELSYDLNANPSVVDKYPDDIELGLNTCYFINPDVVSRNQARAHRIVAAKSIVEAFKKQSNKEAAPWLPVALGDPSRGWLMLEDLDQGFSVNVGETQTGWFPEFGVEEIAFSPAYATAIS